MHDHTNDFDMFLVLTALELLFLLEGGQSSVTRTSYGFPRRQHEMRRSSGPLLAAVMTHAALEHLVSRLDRLWCLSMDDRIERNFKGWSLEFAPSSSRMGIGTSALARQFSAAGRRSDHQPRYEHSLSSSLHSGLNGKSGGYWREFSLMGPYFIAHLCEVGSFRSMQLIGPCRSLTIS